MFSPRFHRATSAFFLLGGSVFIHAAEKPNIILIYIDDMGFADLSCYGGQYPTPNIDKLAVEGIRFSQYYSACPISSPSRVGITTGMYPTRWGINTFLQTRAGNATAEQNDFLDNRAPSLARILKTSGYTTAHFGKWHMGGGRDVYNAPAITTYGFDEYSSTWESPDPDEKLTATNWIWSDFDEVKRWDRTAYFVDKTLDFLAKNKDKPCYINLWPDDVHTPFVENIDGKPSPDNNWQKESAFTNVLKEMDIQIGRLMQGLKDLGIDEETLIIFTSDNGPNPRYEGRRTLNLRAQKGQLYEGGIRLPLIIRWPGRVPANKLNSQSIIASVDFLPTICAITDSPLSEQYPLDGLDRSGVLLGGEDEARPKPLFWEFGKTKANPNAGSPHIAVREGDWKLLVNADGSRTELYNLKTDFQETTNVASQNAAIAQRLKSLSIDWFNASFREFADLDTGTEEITSDKVFRIFPNPVSDFLAIQTSLKNYSIEIAGIDGKRVILPNRKTNSIDISELNPGMYVISIQGNGQKYHRKFLKNNK